MAKPNTVLCAESLNFVLSAPKGDGLVRTMRSAVAGDAAALDAIRAVRRPVEIPPDVSVSPCAVGGVPGLLHMPRGVRPARVIVHFHGGGWVIGSSESCGTFCAALAGRTGDAVFAPDYRLAPEHPFPAALDDAAAVVRSLASDGLPPSDGNAVLRLPIVLSGDSAGGELAAVIASGAAGKDLAENVSAVLLQYPCTDLADVSSQSWRDYAEGFGMSAAEMVAFIDCYAPDAASRADPRLSPANADLSSFPPCLVVSAECDVLRDQGAAFAEKLRAKHRVVERLEYEGTAHMFVTKPGGQPSAFRRLVEDCAKFLLK